MSLCFFAFFHSSPLFSYFIVFFNYLSVQVFEKPLPRSSEVGNRYYTEYYVSSFGYRSEVCVITTYESRITAIFGNLCDLQFTEIWPTLLTNCQLHFRGNSFHFRGMIMLVADHVVHVFIFIFLHAFVFMTCKSLGGFLKPWLRLANNLLGYRFSLLPSLEPEIVGAI